MIRNEVYPLTERISVIGIVNDEAPLTNFHGFLLSPNDKIVWSDTLTEISNTELQKELVSLSKPFIPNGSILPIIRQLCGQKVKKKNNTNLSIIQEKEELIMKEEEYKDDYSDDDDEEEEEDSEEDEEAEDDAVIDEDVEDEDDFSEEEEE